MLENIKAVIFDLDGTLVDSMWMWKSIDVEYLGRNGIAVPEDIQAFQEELEVWDLQKPLFSLRTDFRLKTP